MEEHDKVSNNQIIYYWLGMGSEQKVEATTPHPSVFCLGFFRPLPHIACHIFGPTLNMTCPINHVFWCPFWFLLSSSGPVRGSYISPCSSSTLEPIRMILPDILFNCHRAVNRRMGVDEQTKPLIKMTRHICNEITYARSIVNTNCLKRNGNL